MADASEHTSVNTQTAQPQGTFDSSGKNMSMMISEMLAGINSISDAIGYLKDRKTEEKDSDGGKSVSEMLAKTVSDMRQSVYDGYMAALSDERQMEAEDKEREAMLAQNAAVSKKESGDGKSVYDFLQKENPETRRAANSDKQVDLLKSLVEMQNKALEGKDSRTASEKIADGIGMGGVMNWFRTRDQRKLEAEEAKIARQMKHAEDKEKAAEARYKLARLKGDKEGMSGALSERNSFRETRVSAGKKLQSLMTPLDEQMENRKKRRAALAKSRMESVSGNVSSISGSVKTAGSLVTGIAGAVKGSPEIRRDDGKLNTPSLSVAANVDKIRAMHESIAEHTKQIHLLLMDRGDTAAKPQDELTSKIPGLLKTVLAGLGIGAAVAMITYAVKRTGDAVRGFGVIGKAFSSAVKGGMAWMSETRLGSFMKSSWLKATERIGKVARPMLAAVTSQIGKVGNAARSGWKSVMSVGGLAGKAVDGMKAAGTAVRAGAVSYGAKIASAGSKAVSAVKAGAGAKYAAFAAKHATAFKVGKGVGTKLANPYVSAAIDAGEAGYYLHKGNYAKATAAALNAAAYAIPGVGPAVGAAAEVIRMGVPAAMDAVDKKLDKSRYKAQLKARGLTDAQIDKVVSGKAKADSFKDDTVARTLASKYGVDESMTKKFLEAKKSNKFGGDFKQYYSTMEKYMNAPVQPTVRTTPLNSEKTDGKTQAERDSSRAKMTAKELVLEFSTSPAIQSLFNRTADRSGASVGATLGG